MPSESFDISYYKNITIVRVRSQIRLIPTVIVLVRTCCETKDYLIHFYEKVTYEKFHEWLYDKQRDFTKKSYRKMVRKVRVKIMIVPAAHLLIAKYGSDGDINDGWEIESSSASIHKICWNFFDCANSFDFASSWTRLDLSHGEWR